MAEQILDHVNVDALFQEMGGEAVTQRVHGHGLVEARGCDRLATGPLQRTRREGTSRVGAKTPRDARLHQLDDAADGGLRVVRLHEIEVALGSRRAEIGDRALIYSMGAGDDAALRCLPEDFSETHHRHRAG